MNYIDAIEQVIKSDKLWLCDDEVERNGLSEYAV